MKITRTFLLLGLAFSLSLASYAQLETPRGSQKAAVMQRVGTTDITITYSRPSVNGREIWGKLVPYGMNDLGFGTSKAAPWRAGANENTTINFTHDVSIEGKQIKAGTYGLHINVKDANNATIILSKDNEAWGSYFYEPENDALRADVKIEDAPHTEQLRYEFNDVKPNSAVVSLDWEKKSIPFKIEVDVINIVMNTIRNQFKGQKGFTRQNWEQAAQYALNNGGDLNEALQWADAAIAGQFFSKQTFNNTSIKAGILNKMGKQAEALKLMDDFLPNATIFEVHQYGRQLLGFGLNDKALEVFQFNAKNHKNTWPVNYGLARAYSAKGDHKKAVSYLEKALKNAPNPAAKGRVQANIDKAKKGEAIN